MLLRLLSTALRRPKASAADLEAAAHRHYQRGELDAAEQAFREAALLAPANANAWSNYAALLMKRRKYAAAAPVLAELAEREPGLAEAQLDLGTCHLHLGDNRQAIVRLERAVALKPELHAAHANLLDAYLAACEWTAVERWRADFLEYRRAHSVAQWAQRLYPLSALMLFSPDLTRPLAIQRARQTAQAASATRRAADTPRGHRDARIRVGYVSSDFNDHALGHLTYGLYEAHDRGRFEIYAYSTGPRDDSECERHIRATCDHFVDARDQASGALATRIEADAIDILVDMNGYTAGSRRDVFALRPAPLQVNYLGYPGTSGAEYMDYFVTDGVATPPGLEYEFTEHLVYLPESYQANHREARIAADCPTRPELGLPDEAFVFCCFNALRKIDPAVFASWMDILLAVPSSVLWLVRGGEAAQENLRRAAAARGLDPARLVFAPRAQKDVYLARQRHADLFLDTWAYNAHTSGSDALWMGLPVLTCPGSHFAARVGASLLHACAMPELVADSREAYIEAAVRLANEPARLSALKAKLAEKRMHCALFDIRRYVRHLEAAYGRMHALHSSGRPPESFAVGADGPPAL